jgi:hypothetical protein
MTLEESEKKMAMEIVAKFKTLPPACRAIVLHRTKVLATPTIPQHDPVSYRFNAALYPMLLDADREARFREREGRLRKELSEPLPPLPIPTRRDVVALAMWGVAIATPVVIVGFGYGLAIGLIEWAASLAWLVGYGIGAVMLLCFLSALPKPDFWSNEQEERPRGDSQTVIVNVFTSQGGNVNANANEKSI